jgi:hypothetical protein
MRYEDWTFREAEVRLAQHQELRTALGLQRVPDYTTLYRFVRRLETEVVAHATWGGGRAPAASHAGGHGCRGRCDGVLTDGSQPLLRGSHAQSGRRADAATLAEVGSGRGCAAAPCTGAARLRWTCPPANASSTLRPVVDMARQTGAIGLVVADAEFASERTHHHIRDQLGADSSIPAKRGKSTWQPHGIRAQMRSSFPTVGYRQRAVVERVFSAAKRKRSSRAPGRLPLTQHLQVLLLGLAYDISRVRRALSLSLG